MAGLTPLGSPLPARRASDFAEAAGAARINLRRALDFVIIHELQRATASGPAAALNQPTVLAAVAAWERFCADFTVLADGDEWHGTGRSASSTTKAHLITPAARAKDQPITAATSYGEASRRLVGLSGSTEIIESLDLMVIYSWRGARPDFRRVGGLDHRPNDYHRPALWKDDPKDALSAGEILYQSFGLRHAIAHSFLPQMGDGSIQSGRSPRPSTDGHWLTDPAQQFWRSDSKDGLSVQAGCARGVLALVIQLLDQVVVGMARNQTGSAKRTILASRPPREWFEKTLPAGSRSTVDSDLELWRGRTLVRIES